MKESENKSYNQHLLPRSLRSLASGKKYRSQADGAQ
jgi:hypothetical protein